ncbi:MAG: DUF6056 family protein [Lachnospiraceae bacterium]
MKTFRLKLKQLPYYYVIPTILIFIGALYIVCNYLTPIVLDDCGYTRKGQTIWSIIQDQSHDYMTFNGRFLAHGCAQFVGGILGKSVFNILNTLMAVSLIYILCLCSARSNHNITYVLVALASFLVWFAYPDQYVTMFMVAGSMNYLWGSAIVLTYYALYMHACNNTNSLFSTRLIIFTSVYAFIAGVWGEIYSLCLCPAIFLDLIINKTHRNKITYFLFIFFSIGACMEILAPGNFARLSRIDANNVSTLAILGTRMVSILQEIIQSPLIWIWISIVFCIILLKLNKIKVSFIENIIPIIAIIISILFITITGTTWSRTMFAIYSFSFIIILRCICKLKLSKMVSTTLTLAIMVAISIDASHEYSKLKQQNTSIKQLITDSLQDSTSNYVTLNKAESSRKTFGINVLSSDSTNWRNQTFARYYHVAPKSVVPLEVHQAMSNKKKYPKQKLIPINNNYSILLTDTVLSTFHYVYIRYMCNGYIFHNKIRRLIESIGCTEFAHNIYKHNTDIPFGKYLLEYANTIDVNVPIHSPDGNEAGYITYEGYNKLIFIRNTSLPKYLMPIQDITITP